MVNLILEFDPRKLLNTHLLHIRRSAVLAADRAQFGNEALRHDQPHGVGDLMGFSTKSL